MTITARLARRQTAAAKTMLDRIATELPLAVDIITQRIDTGGDIDRGPVAEDAGIRAIGGHSDPTADAAINRATLHARHLDDIADQLATLALTLRLLLEPCSREVVSAANREDHPRCGELTPRDIKLEEWYTLPNKLGRVPVDCTANCGYDGFRDDGSPRYRSDGLCDADRMARYRWLKRSDSAA